MRPRQIDPHGDNIHMGRKNRMKPAVSDKQARGRLPGGVNSNGFVREFS